MNNAQRLKIMKSAFHYIQLNAQVVMDGDKVGEMIELICRWSYAHRQGNGELSEYQQKRLVDKAYKAIHDHLHMNILEK